MTAFRTAPTPGSSEAMDGTDGKQYIVVAANGGGSLADRSHADSAIAFALP
jgi:hypothetical protein